MSTYKNNLKRLVFCLLLGLVCFDCLADNANTTYAVWGDVRTFCYLNGTLKAVVEGFC